jgi:hypothetical protein
MSEVTVGVSLATQLHVLAVGSVGSAEALVAIKTRYPEVAPVTADQLRVGGTATPVAPLDGLDIEGAGRFWACAMPTARKSKGRITPEARVLRLNLSVVLDSSVEPLNDHIVRINIASLQMSTGWISSGQVRSRPAVSSIIGTI